MSMTLALLLFNSKTEYSFKFVPVFFGLWDDIFFFAEIFLHSVKSPQLYILEGSVEVYDPNSLNYGCLWEVTLPTVLLENATIF